jgi:hypothetical protein
MKYNCLVCKYSGDDSGNWFRHINSKKHLKNVSNNTNLEKEQDGINQLATSCQPVVNRMSTGCQPDVNRLSTGCQPDVNRLTPDDKSKFVCSSCNDNFTTRQALSRHKKYRCLKNKQNDALIIELKKQNEELKNDKEYLKNTTIEAVTAVKYSSAALKFVTENYSNAPLLKPMPDYLAIKKDCGERDLARVYCEFYRDGTLVRYLAQFFLDHYKKTKPEEQSFWNTDCSRLSYVICTIVDNQASWITDKKGVELKKQVIKPLFDHIEKELYDFLKNSDNIKYTSLINSCTLLIQDIQSSVICDELIRYLAPHFQIPNYKTPLAIMNK